MPQLIFFGLLGAVVWYGYKAFKRESERVNEELREEEVKKTKMTELEAGEDGVYRPKDQD